ncbi:MAG: V-type ATPase 116kDa subunit family protein [Porphyromonadaceae bacterium]|nr:V-type ATPase 116kDa subunit family protein [Porphyromonadaceae bacterium]
MIQRMSKYSFVIYHREYEEFLLELRELGVVHITQRNNPKEVDHLKAMLDRRAHLVALRRTLADYLPEDMPEPEYLPEISEQAGEAVVQSLEEALAQRSKTLSSIQLKRQEIAEQEIWGNFEPVETERLGEAGYHLAFYAMPATAFTEDYRAEYEAIAIARSGANQYFVRLERAGTPPAPDAEAIKPPTRSLTALRQDLTALEQQLKAEDEALRATAPARFIDLKAYDKVISDSYMLGAARLQAVGEADDKLMLLEGWVPTAGAAAMEQALSQTGYYYQQVEIVDEDKIPVLLKNNFFARLFEPITSMFSLPNYSEIDQTALFAPFFLLFFGLCFGDGGYGLLVFVLATIYRIKTKDGKDMARLLQWLGGGAFVIGLLMGTFFGVTLGYAKAEDYFLNQDNLMKLSVVLGLIQIFFAKGVAAYKIKVQRGVKYSLAPFAWISMLLGLGAMVLLPRLELELPAFVPYIIYGIVGVSALVAFFYNMPGKNPFLNFGAALWTAYNMASGLLGDTLSYIRLFAIGLTGGILGGVFNQLAVEQTEGLPWLVRVPMMLLILLVGHGLNISLAMISSFVHPLRLTFVEFYKNSEFEGGGKAYQPLKK